MINLEGGKYDVLYGEAIRAGLATPDKVEWMRQRGIHPATQPWTPPTPAKQRPAWLAFLLRTRDRLTAKRPWID